jgi:adenylosuccinate lyase
MGQSAHKFGTDLRLLAHEQEVEEPVETEQVGSSAMAYKRNPMRAERMCGLARFVSSLVVSAEQTAATQWLERTLDDSVNRRLTLPQAFLATDAILRLAANIIRGLMVNSEVISRHVGEFFPFMASENVLMAAVAQGGDRQVLHDRIRLHSRAVMERMKAGTGGNDLLDRLHGDPAFASLDLGLVCDPTRLTGRAASQVDEFIRDVVRPIWKRHGQATMESDELKV